MGLKDIRPGKTIVKLDREREIRFDLNAMAEAELLNIDIDESIKKLVGNSKVALRGLLYVSLKHEDKELTLEKAGALVPFGKYTEIRDTIIEALVNSLPRKVEEVEGEVTEVPEKKTMNS